MTKPKNDLTGCKFGRLTVLMQCDDYVYPDGNRRRTIWLCECDCGELVEVEQSNLVKGNSNSCGCLGRENNIIASTKHGDRHTRLYSIWCNIKTRCYNENNVNYIKYGARGIEMCDEWKNSYVAFKKWAIDSGYDDNDKSLSIDRIDVNGDYCPENCRWATPKEQANNRRNTKCITYNNVTRSISE